nr:hypothetical protein BaRGS_019816 [Batillaria attramentaria]
MTPPAGRTDSVGRLIIVTEQGRGTDGSDVKLAATDLTVETLTEAIEKSQSGVCAHCYMLLEKCYVMKDPFSNTGGSMNYLRLVTRDARLVMNDARLVICDARLVICDARLVMRYPRLVMGYPRLVMRYPRLVMGYRDN